MLDLRFDRLFMISSLLWVGLVIVYANRYFISYALSDRTEFYWWIDSLLLSFSVFMVLFFTWNHQVYPRLLGRFRYASYFLPLVVVCMMLSPWIFTFFDYDIKGWVEPFASVVFIFPISIMLFTFWRLLGAPMTIVVGYFIVALIWSWVGNGVALWTSRFEELVFVVHGLEMIPYALNYILLGAALDTVSSQSNILNRLMIHLNLRSAPKIWRRHFWSWILVLFFYLDLSDVSVIDQVSTGSFSSGLIALSMVAIIWALVRYVLRTNRVANWPYPVRISLNLLYHYFLMMVSFTSVVFPGSLVIISWAWREQNGTMLSKLSNPNFALRHLLSFLCIMIFSVTMLLADELLGLIDLTMKYHFFVYLLPALVFVPLAKYRVFQRSYYRELLAIFLVLFVFLFTNAIGGYATYTGVLNAQIIILAFVLTRRKLWLGTIRKKLMSDGKLVLQRFSCVSVLVMVHAIAFQTVVTVVAVLGPADPFVQFLTNIVT